MAKNEDMSDEVRKRLIAEFQAQDVSLREDIDDCDEERKQLDEQSKTADSNDRGSIEAEITQKLIECRAKRDTLARVTGVIYSLQSGWDGTCVEPDCGVSIVARLELGHPTHKCAECKDRIEKRSKQVRRGCDGQVSTTLHT